MKNNPMNELDDQIRAALNSDENKLLGQPDDGLRIDQLMRATLQTRHRSITILGFIFTLAFLALGVWAAIRFFESTETKQLLTFGFAFTYCMIAVAMLKIWFWMEMQRIAITREVKKVELLAARLLQEMESRTTESV